MMRYPASFGVVLLLFAGLSFGQEPKDATPLPADQKVVIDGKLDEPSWQQAPSSNPFLWLKTQEKSTPPAATTFKVLRDADSVYFGITCAEPLMGQLRDAPLNRDGPVHSRDCVELFLSPEGRPVNYYQFMVSAGNTILDQYFIEGGNTTGGEYNAPLESAVHQGKDFWSVEVRIPLMAFFRTPSGDFSDRWLVNIARERHPAKELTTWSPLRRKFHEPTQFQTIGNMPRKDPRYDLYMAGLSAQLTSADGPGRWAGDLKLDVVAAAAGEYRLSVAGDGQALVTDRPVKIAAGSSTLTVDQASFAALGKVMYTVRLTDADGRVVADAAYAVRTEYAPMMVELDEPFYGNAFFPGQKVDRIRGRVTLNLPPQTMENSALRVTLTGNPVPLTVKPSNGVAQFNFDAKGLTEGEYPLTFEVVHGEQVVANTSLVVRKLPQPAGSCVYLDEHRRLVVDGKPIFARGWYGGTTWMVSQALLDQYGDRPNSKFVNTWMCQINMEAERIDKTEGSSDHVRQDVEPSAKVFEVMRQRIEEARASKTVWWYYLSDEPECRGLSPVYLKHQYDFIKKLDPYRPVMIITRSPKRYTGCADILNPHPYLSPTVDAQGVRRMSSPKDVRDQIRTVLSAGKGKIPAWLTPQAFSYRGTDPQADFPTFVEYRCMMWDAVANGATGFTPFIYSGQFASVDLRLGCDFVYESMAALDEFLNTTEPPLPIRVQAANDGVDARAIRVNGQVLLIAVNLLDQAVTADIQVDGLDAVTELHGFRDDTHAQLTDGRLTLQFAPYQVRLLTSVKRDQQLRSVADIQRQIDAARAALKKPGNLLFDRGDEIESDSSDTYMSGRSVAAALTDGICDALAWANWANKKIPAWLELQFPNFVPTSKTVKFHTATIVDAELMAWKKGDWLSVGKIENNQSPVLTFSFPQPLKTVKLKLVITKVKPGTKAEVYEVEMYP